jgi:hypothetical protein
MTAPAATRNALTIKNVNAVDDAGGVHYETVMTGAYIVDLIDRGILKFTGNIRPDHLPDQRMGIKTRRKIDKWTEELIENQAVIGNISMRLNPDTTDYEVEPDEDGQLELTFEGDLDSAVDSLSRIKAINTAAKNPYGGFDTKTRFAVRIWIADDELAAKIATIYNTRGDKVNDTAAKFAWQANAAQRMARELMRKSAHLGLDNIEVLKNNVSASSPKLTAFNTLAGAIETAWQDEPFTPAEEQAHVDFLARFWDELVKVRPEFGRLSMSDRRQLRGSSVAGTALSIYGAVAVADSLHRNKLDPATKLAGLNSTVKLDDGREVDYFSYDNPVWQRIGVIVSATDDAGNVSLSLRMSFQTRDAIGKELKTKLALPS